MTPVPNIPSQPSGPVSTAERLLTVAEACERLRISRWTFYRLVQTKQLRTITIGRSRRVTPAAIAECIAQLQAMEDAA